MNTPRIDFDGREYPHPDHAQKITFEGCECVVMAPEEYAGLWDIGLQLERELAKCREALCGLTALKDQFDQTDRNHAEAYYSFYKGHYEEWAKAKEALETDAFNAQPRDGGQPAINQDRPTPPSPTATC